MSKTVLVENDVIKLIEKEDKNNIYLILSFLDLNLTDETPSISTLFTYEIKEAKISIFMSDLLISSFGYTNEEVDNKNIDLSIIPKVKYKKRKIIFNFKKKKVKKPTKKAIIKSIEAVLDYFDGEEFSTVEKEAFIKLEKVYLQLIGQE